MFTSDSQHPPRSRHAVHLGDKSGYSFRLALASTHDFGTETTKAQVSLHIMHRLVRALAAGIHEVWIKMKNQT